MTTLTILQAAVALNVSQERIRRLCKAQRLGYTIPRHGRAWVITDEEIAQYRAIGPRKPPGRPRKA